MKRGEFLLFFVFMKPLNEFRGIIIWHQRWRVCGKIDFFKSL